MSLDLETYAAIEKAATDVAISGRCLRASLRCLLKIKTAKARIRRPSSKRNTKAALTASRHQYSPCALAKWTVESQSLSPNLPGPYSFSNSAHGIIPDVKLLWSSWHLSDRQRAKKKTQKREKKKKRISCRSGGEEIMPPYRLTDWLTRTD